MVGRFLGFIYLILFVIELNARPNLKSTTENKENYPWTARMRFIFFQVINPLEVVTGVEMAKFEERGPYTYREVLEKRNQVEGDSTVQFEQYRHFEFDAAQSCEGCLKTDTVRILNQPLIGAVAGAMAQGGGLVSGIALGILAGAIQNTADSPDLFLVDSVDNILFAGVNNELVQELLTNSLLKNKLPPAIQDNGFAIFNTKNATTHNECYEVDVGVERHTEINLWGPTLAEDDLNPDLSEARTCPSVIAGEVFSCRSTKNFPYWWPYKDIEGNERVNTTCNLLRGTNGEQFPPFLDDRRDEPLWIFSTDLCRSMSLKYLEDHDIDGIRTLRYTLPQG
ncbi:scavenger receptor class B member 1 [Eurytemora carolleeae]|uniref:scavenger receptor class B member 1 n=1 Tax=Eurytemora carolleeae TaxID=1294199 RepID=UPI000C78EC95|nr:scavenger receptor class B member 1 [Eurytemora carolleeae]|eukprot:XP_023345427.1 scavenger receptor class B member 1-like [Eurytemora affinis]